TDPLLLIGALEIETADVGTGRGFVVAHLDDVVAVGQLFPHGFAAVQVAHLVYVGQFHGFAHGDGAGVWLVHARNHLEQRGFTGTVTTDDADNGTWRHAERDIFI